MSRMEWNCQQSHLIQPSNFSSGNLRKTSDLIDCLGTERPLTSLNNPLFVLPLGSNIFSPNLFTHSFRTPSVCVTLFFPLFFFFLLFLYVLALPLSTPGQWSIFTRSQRRQTSGLFKGLRQRWRKEGGGWSGKKNQRETESKFPGWLAGSQ